MGKERCSGRKMSQILEMKVGVGNDDGRGADVIMLVVGTEGVMSKTLNHQTKLNHLSQKGQCLMGPERWVMVERGWIEMRSVQFSTAPASGRLLRGEVLSGPSTVVR